MITKLLRYPIVRGFNLVEITLAIGVVAFGLTTIISLTVIASRQTRDAATETLVSQIAESVLGVFEIKGRATRRWMYEGNYLEGPQINFADDAKPQKEGLDEFFPENGSNETKKALQKRVGIQGAVVPNYATIRDVCNKYDILAPIGQSVEASEVKYYMEAIGKAAGQPDADKKCYYPIWLCRVIQEDADKKEFVALSAFVRMWRQNGGSINHKFIVPTVFGNTKTLNIGSEVSYKNMQAASLWSTARVFVEVSWPTNVPETYRNKRLFYKEFCK